MLEKWAAWPASCINVASAVLPEPTAVGSASDVKFVSVGCQDPSGFFQAGWGQWQNPFEYLCFRSSRSRVIVAPRYLRGRRRSRRDAAAADGKGDAARRT